MANIEDQLAKKPFKKKSYRSYLSLGETLEDLSPTPAIDKSTNLPIDKPEPAALTSPNPPQTVETELTETQPTESTLTESQPTQTQSTDSQATGVQPTESQLAETQSTESQMAKSQRTERQRAKSKRTETKSTKTQLTESTLTETQSTEIHPAARNRRLTPKLTRTQLTESKLTETQSTQPAFSKSKSHWQLPEADVLDLLAETDPQRKLKGNEWPVFIYMSLRAFEWDFEKKSRGDGVRRFAGSFLANGTGLSPSTCNAAINELIAKGYVELLEKDNYAGNLYRVEPVLLFRLNPEYADRKSVNQDSVNGNSDRNLNGSQTGTSPKVGHVPDRKSSTVLDPDRSRKSLKSLSLIFDAYLDGLRSPTKAKGERELLESLFERNPDLSEREWRMVWSFVLGAKDNSGNPIEAKILWMTNGFDKFLRRARSSLAEEDRKQKLEEERLAAEKEAEERERAEAYAAANLDPAEVKRLCDESLGEMPKNA